MKRRVLPATYLVVAAASAGLILLRPFTDRLADLGVYWGATRAVLNGLPLYEFQAGNGDPFTYPPAAAILFMPLTRLDFTVAGIVWTTLTLAAIPLFARLLMQRWPGLAQSRRTQAAWLVALGLLLSAPGQSTIRFGQVSLFIVMLSAIDASGVVPQRFRGILVGVCTAVKLTPGLFVVHFLLTRQWRAAAQAVASFGVVTGLAAARLPRDSHDYWTRELFAVSQIGDAAALGNQSVNGMLLRSGLDAPLRPLVWLALIGLLTIVGLWRATQLERERLKLPAAVLVGCTTLAVSPVSWMHHQVWTVLAAMLLIGAPRPLARTAGWVLFATMTISLVDIVGRLGLGDIALTLVANARGIGVACLVAVGLTSAYAAPRISTQRRRALVVKTLVPVSVAAIAFVLIPTPLFGGAFHALNPQEAVARLTLGRAVCAPPRESDTSCTYIPIYEPTMVNYGSGFLPTAHPDLPSPAYAEGFTGPDVASLRYRSAPGAPWREVPIGRTTGEYGTFAFTDVDFSYAQLFAYDGSGHLIGEVGDKLRT